MCKKYFCPVFLLGYCSTASHLPAVQVQTNSFLYDYNKYNSGSFSSAVYVTRLSNISPHWKQWETVIYY